MLIGVFKSNQKIVNVLVMLLAIILWLPSFFIGEDLSSLSLISTKIKWLDTFISLFLVVGQAIYLNFIVNEFKLIQQNSHLTSLFLVVLNSSCLWLLDLNEVVIANTFLLIAFHQVLRLYDANSKLALLFNAGFLIAVASLIYLPNIFYFALIWMGLIYMTTPKIRDFVCSLIGLSVPIIYFISYHFVFGSLSEVLIDIDSIRLFNIEWKDVSLLNKWSGLIMAGTILASCLGLTRVLGRGAVKTRKMLFTVLIMSTLGLFSLLLNKMDYLATFIMITIPVSIILASFFQHLKKKWIAELLFSFLLVGIVFSYFS